MINASTEIERITVGISANDVPDGFDTERIVAYCSGNAMVVLSRCREVLQIVLSINGDWPNPTQWRSLLPDWFVEASGEERTKDESENWRKKLLLLPPDQQAEALQQERWSVNAWTFWFKPENHNRQWRWWDAKLVSDDLLLVEIEVNDWPIAWGALEWLLRASGAQRTKAE